MFAQPFAYGSSPLHRLDPRARLATAMVSAVCLALVQTRPAALYGLALGTGLLLLSRPPWGTALRRLLAVNLFLLFLCLLTPFSLSGDAVWQWGPLAVSRQGLALALVLWAKSNALVLCFLALVATMPVSTAGYALQKLRCPAKIVFLLLFAGRYVHDIADEWRTLLAAARLRGFRARTSFHSYRTLASLLGILLLRGLDRARRVHEAMLLRGFQQRFFCVTPFRAHARDALFAAFMVAALIVLCWLEFR